jgi:hypothetical protein
MLRAFTDAILMYLYLIGWVLRLVVVVVVWAAARSFLIVVTVMGSSCTVIWICG